MPKIVPLGDKILVKRRTIGEKAGSIVLPQEVQERATDLADVVYVPDLSFGDSEIIDNYPQIVEALIKKAKSGDSDALIALLRINEFVKYKSIKVGDGVFISKYVGTDFHATGEKENLTLVKLDDILGVIDKEQ